MFSKTGNMQILWELYIDESDGRSPKKREDPDEGHVWIAYLKQKKYAETVAFDDRFPMAI